MGTLLGGGPFMTRTLHRLSPTKVASAKTPGYVADGGNLYLRVAVGNKVGDKQPAVRMRAASSRALARLIVG